MPSAFLSHWEPTWNHYLLSRQLHSAVPPCLQTAVCNWTHPLKPSANSRTHWWQVSFSISSWYKDRFWQMSCGHGSHYSGMAHSRLWGTGPLRRQRASYTDEEHAQNYRTTHYDQELYKELRETLTHKKLLYTLTLKKINRNLKLLKEYFYVFKRTGILPAYMSEYHACSALVAPGTAATTAGCHHVGAGKETLGSGGAASALNHWASL